MSLRQDERPHVLTKIFDENYKGLLDSGAQSSIMNHALYEKMLSKGLALRSCNVILTTADGTGHKAMGYMDVPYKVEDKVRIVPTLIVKESAVGLILGWDFWNAFGIVPYFMPNKVNVDVAGAREEAIQYCDNENLEDFESDITPPKCINVEEEHSLTFEQESRLSRAMSMFPFCNPSGELNKTQLREAKIDTGNASPVRCKLRYDPPWKLQRIIQEIDRLENRGIIKKIEFSEWLNPIIGVPKANGKIRICLDARKLNEITKKNVYPQQNANRIMSVMGKAKYISTLDMTDAFFQIPLHIESQAKTAFAVPMRGTYVYQRMPMGLTNSGAELCMLIDSLFGSEFEPFAFPYLDDVVIITETFEQHIEILERIAKKFRFANLSVSPEKSKFCYKKLKYLGHIIDESGVAMDKSRIDAIENFATPTTVKEVQRLIGMAGWYRRFICDFARITAPITELIKKNVKFEWTEERERAFRSLIKALTSAPVLAAPNYTLPFEIQVDASQMGCGAVLIQKEGDQEDRVIAYMSQKFSDTQRRYHVTELECLGVILAIEKFRPYVEGSKFRVITDHHSLLWLKGLKDPTGRLARWALRLQAYDFELIHRKGKLHVVPDAISRAILMLTTSDINDTTDKWYLELYDNATKEPQMNDNVKIHNGMLYIKVGNDENNECAWKLCVPQEHREAVIRENHDSERSCHFGRYKTIEKTRSAYYWPRMRLDISEYVRKCEVCKAMKPYNQSTTPPAGNFVEAIRPFRIIATDICGPFPLSKNQNQYLLVAVDIFSKFTVLKAVRNATALAVVKFLEEDVILRYGCPEIIVSDNGQQYKSELYAKLLRSYGIRSWYTANYFAQANPTECANKTIGTALRSFMRNDTNHKDWDKHVTRIANAMNSATHTSTGKTPHEIVFGRRMAQSAHEHQTILDPNMSHESTTAKRDIIFEKIQQRINEAREKSAKHYNLRTRSVNYNVGDVVYRENKILSNASKYFTKKLAPRFIKCTIEEKTGTNTYRLREVNSGKVAIHHAINFHK